MNVNYKLISLKKISDVRGNLSVCEFGKSIPFDVKRTFIVYQVPLIETRGEHAHKICHQFLMCLRGSIMAMADDGFTCSEFLLNSPSYGLYLPPMVWSAQYNYSPDALLVVFASEYYDPDDYIRVYAEFKRLVGKN